jgi:hypothetical protein
MSDVRTPRSVLILRPPQPTLDQQSPLRVGVRGTAVLCQHPGPTSPPGARRTHQGTLHQLAGTSQQNSRIAWAMTHQALSSPKRLRAGCKISTCPCRDTRNSEGTGKQGVRMQTKRLTFATHCRVAPSVSIFKSPVTNVLLRHLHHMGCYAIKVTSWMPHSHLSFIHILFARRGSNHLVCSP